MSMLNGSRMTWIERVFARVTYLRPEMSDRVVLARLIVALMMLPVILPIKFWRVQSWTRPK